MIAFLVGYGWYQVAYGTNESDYKYGYKDGLGEYHRCYINHICAVSEDIYTPACENGLGDRPSVVIHQAPNPVIELIVVFPKVSHVGHKNQGIDQRSQGDQANARPAMEMRKRPEVADDR